MATTTADVKARSRGAKHVRPPGGAKRWLAVAFLAPALVFLGALVIYPTLDTVFQSFQNPDRQFVGVDNYKDMIESDTLLTALKNNAIWVATAPAIITGLGLMFAVLTERVRYATALKVVLFMPMAISFLSTGVIWRLMYDDAPNQGVINAGIKTVTDVAGGAGAYPTASVVANAPVTQEGNRVVANGEFAPGETGLLPLVGMTEEDLPEDAVQAAEPNVPDGAVGAVVWRDFRPGGGEVGVIEDGELGLPGATVQLLNSNGEVAGTETTGSDGSVVFTDLEGSGPYGLAVGPATFEEGFTGVNWLSSSLVTPAIIFAFSWMWAGFSVVVIGAGLAALPRDVLEAARVDGANEWQTFRLITLPLLAPVLGVVFVTLMINVLKIFDIVLVTAPGAVQDEANVIALELYRVAFTSRDYGVGSAIAVLLFMLVIPMMILNIRRFRREQ